MRATRFVSIFSFLLFLGANSVMAQNFELLTFTTEDNGKIEAALFQASDTRVVVFAHGAVFNKESWYFLAERFQREGISSLSIDFRGYGNSTADSSTEKQYDVLGAITYLAERGFTDINIVGGSMGGAAVLSALPSTTFPVNKVVLLAPAGGPAISSTATDKLFVVSEDEQMFPDIMKIYAASALPKKLKTYPGGTHAQHLFNTKHRQDLIESIVNFIRLGGAVEG